MLSEAAEFVIQGIAVEGGTFQPEDWAQHLCNALAKTGVDGRKCSSYVRPVVTDGIKSVVVRVALQEANPEAFDMIKRYMPRTVSWCAPGAAAGTPKPAGRFRSLVRSAAIRSATSGNSNPISSVKRCWLSRSLLAVLVALSALFTRRRLV